MCLQEPEDCAACFKVPAVKWPVHTASRDGRMRVYIYIYIHICMIYACIIQHIHIEGHAYIDIEHKMFSVDIRTLAQL